MIHHPPIRFLQSDTLSRPEKQRFDPLIKMRDSSIHSFTFGATVSVYRTVIRALFPIVSSMIKSCLEIEFRGILTEALDTTTVSSKIEKSKLKSNLRMTKNCEVLVRKIAFGRECGLRSHLTFFIFNCSKKSRSKFVVVGKFSRTSEIRRSSSDFSDSVKIFRNFISKCYRIDFDTRRLHLLRRLKLY